ncbi:hypothetical protein HanIR_Chr13g0635951 [Helianthus annuus]|nr:hypothetical protein HanIR_Chr13g0635951 [Helianthus annuus]
MGRLTSLLREQTNTPKGLFSHLSQNTIHTRNPSRYFSLSRLLGTRRHTHTLSNRRFILLGSPLLPSNRTWLTTFSSRTLFVYLPSNPRTLGTLWSLHKEEQVVVGNGS